jgi:hypothetical protein
VNKELVRAAEALVDTLNTAGPDQVVSFGALAGAIGMKPLDLPRLRELVSLARPIALERHQRVIVSQRGTGYRFALSREHQGLAEGKRQSARRSLDKAAKITIHTDLAELTDAEREAHLNTRRAVVMLAAVVSDHDERLRRIEKLLNLPPA